MFSSLRNTFSEFFMGTASSHCTLDADVDPITALTTDGGLVSFVDLDGRETLLSAAEAEAADAGLASVISKLCGSGRHKISVTYDNSPDGGQSEVSELLQPVFAEYQRRGYRSHDAVTHESQHLGKRCSRQTVTMALHTRPPSAEKSAGQKGDVATSATLFEMDLSQAADALRNQHKAALRMLVYQLKLARVVARTMTVAGACRRLRLLLSCRASPGAWKPVLSDEGFYPRVFQGSKSGGSTCVLNERLGVQVLDSAVECMSAPRGIIRVGNTLACQRQIRRFPDSEAFSFQRLQDQLGIEVPWRMSWHIEAGASLLPAVNKVLAMLGAFSQSNRLIRDSINQMHQDALLKDTVALSLRVFITTFGKTAAQLESACEAVDSALAQRGNVVAAVGTGDPAGEFIEAVAGVRDKVGGTQALPPALSIVKQLPLGYTGKGWSAGTWLLRTMHGTAFPVDIGGGGTAAANIIVMGLPGNGKSVVVATALAAAMVKPGRSRLPFIGIIDCGGKVAKATSAGLINYGRHLVGANMQEQLQSIELRRDGSVRLNPFDIAFGTRRATAAGQANVVTLLSRICTPAGQDAPPMMLPELLAAAVAATYDRLAKDMTATRYSGGVEKAVDAALSELRVEVTEETMWWEVRDRLWEARRVTEANAAQRRAVPTLTELAQTISLDEAIGRQYGDVVVHGMSLPRFAADRIYEAISLYPFLGTASNCDLGSARVISFDLMDMMTGTGAAEQKLGDLAALLARNVILQTSGMDKEVVALSDPGYIAHNEEILRQRRHDEGYLVWDELHKTSSGPVMQQAVEQTQAMGRKDGMNTLLSSQTDVHFTTAMKDLASMAIVCGSISAASAERLGTVLGLSETAIGALSSGALQPPSQEGSSLLLWWRSDEKPREALLRNTRSPLLLWQLTSKRVDDLMRRGLAEHVGLEKAGRLLAQAFSAGGCSGEIDALVSETGCSQEEAVQRQIELILNQSGPLRRDMKAASSDSSALGGRDASTISSEP